MRIAIAAHSRRASDDGRDAFDALRAGARTDAERRGLARYDAVVLSQVLAPGRRPWEPAVLRRLDWLLWPLGPHSLIVAQKP